MQLLWLLLAPVLLWLWAVSVPLTLNVIYWNRSILDDCWWRGPTYFVFNLCTAMATIVAIAACVIKAFE